MKKILLTGLLSSVAIISSVFAQEMPDFNNNWEHQPIKTETYLYNSEKFDFESTGGTQQDSIPEIFTDYVYEDEKVTMQTSGWLDAEWKMQIKTEMYLKDESELDSMVMSSYDTVSTSWNRVFKIENEYEGSVQSQSRTYAADSLTGDWYLLSQTDFEYDNSGYLTEEFVSMYSPDSGELVTTSKTEYFLTEGRRDSSKSYFWIPVINQWQVNSRTEYTYNSEGQVEEQIRYDVSILTMDWVRSSRTEYLYNAEGNQYWSAQYNWNAATQGWMQNSKDSTIYDNDSRPLVHINYQKPLVENTLYVREKTFFSYDGATGIQQTAQENRILVYPNPASDFITVRTDNYSTGTVRLFDLSGRLVLEEPVTNKTTVIPVQNFRQGSYLLKINSSEKTHSQIVVIN